MEFSVLVWTQADGRGLFPPRPRDARDYPGNRYATPATERERMDEASDRIERFELIAGCDGEVLGRLANDVLAADPELAVRQDPRPVLCPQQVREPVEGRPITLGEVVLTPAEVELDGTRGFAMVPGKAERAALSGAIVDAALAGGHDRRDEMRAELERVAADREAERERQWAESRHTTVDFETLEDDT